MKAGESASPKIGIVRVQSVTVHFVKANPARGNRHTGSEMFWTYEKQFLS